MPKRVSKLLLLWKMIILISLILHTFQGYRMVMKWVSKQPAVKRYAIHLMLDGCKYRWGGVR